MAKGCCYLFLGPEIGEKQDAIKVFRQKLTAEGGVPEESSFYAGETPLPELMAVLRNGSLFSDTRLFLIKNAEVFKKKEELDILVPYLESPQDNTTLILLSDAIGIDKRLENAVDKANKRIFWELFENRKTEWVDTFFRREGYTIGEDGIETILELVENNTEALKRECSRLMPFLGKGKTITGEEVEKWLSHTREESTFTLFSRIAAGDLSKSLETLHTLLGARETPPGIFAGLAWCFKKLRDYLNLVNSGSFIDDFEFKKIGLASTKNRRDYTMAARRYPSADPCLALLAEFDILLRSGGSALEAILMDLFLYRLITGPESTGVSRRTCFPSF
ncbi:MAG: DNA polymerase III subunit delta [Spirochaetaceae bacterium]|jgi:DNA polymerase-3 subunit delta|nr:DNA polymerase III subunit delta [Spirochaetaceae bacterium]